MPKSNKSKETGSGSSGDNIRKRGRDNNNNSTNMTEHAVLRDFEQKFGVIWDGIKSKETTERDLLLRQIATALDSLTDVLHNEKRTLNQTQEMSNNFVKLLQILRDTIAISDLRREGLNQKELRDQLTILIGTCCSNVAYPIAMALYCDHMGDIFNIDSLFRILFQHRHKKAYRNNVNDKSKELLDDIKDRDFIDTHGYTKSDYNKWNNYTAARAYLAKRYRADHEVEDRRLRDLIRQNNERLEKRLNALPKKAMDLTDHRLYDLEYDKKLEEFRTLDDLTKQRYDFSAKKYADETTIDEKLKVISEALKKRETPILLDNMMNQLRKYLQESYQENLDRIFQFRDDTATRGNVVPLPASSQGLEDGGQMDET